MRWIYILVLTIALTHTVSVRAAADPTQAQAAVDAEKQNADRATKTLQEKLAEYEEAQKKAEENPNSINKDGKLWSEVEKEKEREVALAAKDKMNADSALKTAQDRLSKLKGDAEGEHAGHQSQDNSQQSAGKSGSSAKEKAMAEAMKQAAAQKQQEDQKKDEEQKEKQAERQKQEQEPTQTAKEEKPTQNNNQQEQVATIPEDIKKSLEAPYAKDEGSNSSSESPGKKSSSGGYEDLIKANDELAAAREKETFETLASLNAKNETSPTEETPGEEKESKESKESAKPVTVNEYIDRVAAQNSIKTRSPASAENRTKTSSAGSPRAMKGATSSRLLNSLK
jgi:hypothetical protein